MTAQKSNSAVYKVHHISARKQIDGRDDNPVWAAIPAIDLRLAGETETHLRSKVLWDEASINILFSCDGGGACGKQFATVGDDASICAAQVQIDPNPSETDAYLGFKLDEQAHVQTYVSFGGSYLFRDLHSQGIQASIYREPTSTAHPGQIRWSAELAIPWTNTVDLNMQFGENQIWKARLGCTTEQGRTQAGWPQSSTSAKDARAVSDFGEWAFVK
jgi:hypothetical protein